jgi:methylphosphotriester-DNA--protein-cysteine methyltransferase
MKKRFAIILVLFLVSMILYAAGGDTIVYITKTGSKYHTATCSSLRKSKIETTLRNAVSKGLGPCSRCDPPELSE